MSQPTKKGVTITKRNIVHIEIPAASTTKAAQFYKDLFGWKPTPMEGMDYILWEPGEGPGGAFNPLGNELKPGDVHIYVDSDDIEVDLKRLSNLSVHWWVKKQRSLASVGLGCLKI